MTDSAVWAANRKHWAIYRLSTGFYSAMPTTWGDDYIKGPMDWAVATNRVKRVNQVRSFMGTCIDDKTFDEIHSVYQIMVDRGDIQPVELLDEPQEETA